MNIEDLTLKQLREINALFPTQSQPAHVESCGFWQIGKCYFLRTVTHHFTGRFHGYNGHELLFMEAAWIPDDGRFADAIKSAVFSEVEPFPAGSTVAIGRAGLIDAVEIKSVPRSQK